MSDQVIRIRLDTVDLQAGIQAFGARFPGILARAITKTAVSARQTMVEAISSDTGITQPKVRDAVRIIKQGAAGAYVEATGKRIPLIEFGARGPEPSRGKGRGVSYRLPTGRGVAPHAFIAMMPGTGHRGVFERKADASLPIRELKGPSIVNVFRKYMPDGAKRATEALKTNLQHEISFALKGR